MSKKTNITQSPMAGSAFAMLFKTVKGNTIDRKHLPKFLLMVIFSLSLEPLRWLERRRLKNRLKQFKFKEDPVFILGHWRSGTTFLHNVLCQDPSFGFVSTYQGIYPETMFTGKWMVKNIMDVAMPKKRPSDDMDLSPDLPQEEEFAMGNSTSHSYYNFWFFPKNWRKIYKKYIDFEGASKSLIQEWKEGYSTLIKKALISSNTDRFISKNPPNTGRIKLILEMFPNAKFVFIYRDPIKTYVSTSSFIKKTMVLPKLQDISNEEIKENIHWQYDQLMNSYIKNKSLIPEQNLIEIKFEEFEKQPLDHIYQIYEQLEIPGFPKVEKTFRDYIDAQNSYKKNDYMIPDSIKTEVGKKWKFAFLEWDYDLPESAVKNSRRILANAD